MLLFFCDGVHNFSGIHHSSACVAQPNCKRPAARIPSGPLDTPVVSGVRAGSWVRISRVCLGRTPINRPRCACGRGERSQLARTVTAAWPVVINPGLRPMTIQGRNTDGQRSPLHG